MFKELLHRNEPVSVLPRIDLDDLSFSLLGMVDRGKEQFRKIRSKIEGHTVIRSAHQNWDNTHYCRSLSKDAPRQYSVEELLQVFPANLQTFCDEYCLGAMIQEYPMALNDQGTTGLDKTYKETLSDQAQHFSDKISVTKKNAQRATVETLNSQRLDPWLLEVCQNPNIPEGTKLVWCSPPGHRREGYAGVSPKHHSFIWVYEKRTNPAGQPEMTMTQFRCWPSLTQLQNIQSELRMYTNPAGILPPTSLDQSQLTRRNQVIAEFIEIPPTVDMSAIAECIYRDEDSWAVNSTDMPATTESMLERFGKYREKILQTFLVPLYKQVLSNTPQLQEPLGSPFWKSPEYKNIVHQLDVGFAIIWQHLLKVVEEGIPSMDSVENQTKSLRQLYRLKLQFDVGEINKEGKALFNKLAPQFLSAGQKVLSVGQCGLGTVIPLNLMSKLEQISSLAKFKSLNEITKFEVSKLSVADKHLFRNQILGKFKPLSVRSRSGQSHKFWVDGEYYDIYKQTIYEGPTGKFFGDCDIPLHTGQDAYVLTNAKYHELLGAATSPSVNLANLASEETRELGAARSLLEKNAIRQKYAKQRHFLKHRVGFLEWLNDDFYIGRHPAIHRSSPASV
jgi:hypothetical protein